MGIAHYYTARQSDDEDLARKHFQIALIHIENSVQYFVDKFGEQSYLSHGAIHFQARTYWMSGDLPKAVAIYQQLSSYVNVEEFPHIFIELARVLEASGDVDSAITVYEKAIEIVRDWDEEVRPSKTAFLGDYEEFKERVRQRVHDDTQ